MATIDETELISEGSIPPDDFHDNVERICEIAEYDLELPSDLLSRLQSETSKMLLEEGVLNAITAALATGNVILYGPPGTGKSSVARAICRAYHASVMHVTAHDEWSTYEVIGRQELRVDTKGNEEIYPVNGYFTEAVIRCAASVVEHFDQPDSPQATWLLIDEMNRAKLDKAFGELFSVLGTDELVPITLPHQRVGNRELVVPRRFRIVGTLNSIDRQFVHGMGQALRRRFSFIAIDPPKHAPAELISLDGSNMGSRELKVVIDRSVERIVRRHSSVDGSDREAAKKSITELLKGAALSPIIKLFEFVFGLSCTVLLR